MFLVFLLFFFSINPVYASSFKIFSWNLHDQTSLSIIDRVGVEEKNNSLVIKQDSEQNFFVLEDIAISDKEFVSDIFVRMSKKRMTSYITVSLVDVFTDNVIMKKIFYEQGSIPIGNIGLETGRFYLKVEIFGDDVFVRMVGVKILPSALIKEQDFKIEPEEIFIKKDNITISFQTQEEAQIYIYVYDENESIIHKLLDGNILNSGTYTFTWDPRENFDGIEGKYYYVWGKFENLRSEPIEITKSVYIIP